MCVCVYVCMCVCICVYMCVCICTRVYVCVYTSEYVIYCPIIGCDHLQYQTYLAERPEKSVPYEKSKNSLIFHI